MLVALFMLVILTPVIVVLSARASDAQHNSSKLQQCIAQARYIRHW
jgi:hypothetical protein